MTYRQIIRLFVPPIILNFLRKKPETQTKFVTFDQALRATSGNAYEDIDLVRVVIDKNRIFRDDLEKEASLNLTSLRTLIPLASIEITESLNVIDFGGGGGMHYFVARTALAPNIPIRWNIVETKTMVDFGKDYSNSELNFFDDLDSARTTLNDINLVFTSSALQYCPDPLEVLEKLVNLDSPFLFITRTPFLDGEGKIITSQASRLSDNGPGPLPDNYMDRLVTYPITYVSKISVEKIIRRKYEIRFRIDEGKSNFSFNDEAISLMGYFCVKKP